MPEQPVWVVCLACKGTQEEIVDRGMFSADPGPYSCSACRGTGTILATLADPEMAALIEDGRKWRAGNVKRRAPFGEVPDGVEWADPPLARCEHPTANPEDDGA